MADKLCALYGFSPPLRRRFASVPGIHAPCYGQTRSTLRFPTLHSFRKLKLRAAYGQTSAAIVYKIIKPAPIAVKGHLVAV